MRRSYVLTAVSLGLAGLALAWHRGQEADKPPGFALPLSDLSEDRLFEPRLTASRTYAPCTVTSEPGRLLPVVRCSQISRVENPSSDDTAAEPRSGGTVEEALDRRSRGGSGVVASTVARLEQAVYVKPGDARSLSDLAAAYFIRGHEADEPEDLIRALDAAARACEANPSLEEALFNKALTLERLHLRRLALEAWTAYLGIDDSSEWAEEARRRRDALRAPSLSDRWPGLRARLDAAALQGDETAVKAVVEIAPQRAREYALEELLPHWGRALLADDGVGADRSLRIAAAIGNALQAATGDAAVQRTISAIEAKPSVATLRSLAGGHEALGEGLLLFRKLETKAAQTPFQAAREELHRAGSPAEHWALCGLARCWAYDGRFDEAEAAFEEVVRNAEGAGSPSLAGWAQWGLGWLDVRRRRFSNALGRFSLAEKAFENAREEENLGAVRHFLGEHLFLLGQDAASWRYRFRALRDLSDFPNSFRRHNLLMEGAYAAAREKFLLAGLSLQEEDVLIAEETRDTIIYTEALRARGRLQLELGLEKSRVDKAWRDLESARRSARMVPDSSPGRKLLADSLWAEGEALRLRHPTAALELLSQAVAEYQDLKAPLSVIQALLSRYRTYRALNRDSKAEADLTTSLRILEDPGAAILEEDLKLSYAESIQSVYDEMIDFRWRKSRDAVDTLDLLLRAQAFYRFDSAGRAAVRLNLPNRGVAIVYALLQDRLLCWLIRDGKISISERPVAIKTVEDQVARLVSSLQRTPESGPWSAASEALYDLLVPKSVEDLPEDQIVYFVPDKALNRVPFAALRNSRTQRFLIEEHAVAIAPNLLYLGSASPSNSLGPRTSILLVGNPAFDRQLFPSLQSLDQAEAETAAIGTMFPDSVVLEREEATRERVLEELARAEAFFFIGHAVANASLPSRSHLVLAPSSRPPDAGLLLSSDIAGRRFPRLRLVMLSACSTAGPRSTRTAGLAGLAEPFLRAGAETVVGTLWPVDDRSAGELLVPFYSQLARGQPAVIALRHAQLAALRTSHSDERPVSDWAAFEAFSN